MSLSALDNPQHPPRTLSARSGAGRLLEGRVLGVLLAAHVLLLLLFDYLAADIRTLFSGGLFVGYFGLAVLTLLRPGPARERALAGVALLLLSYWAIVWAGGLIAGISSPDEFNLVFRHTMPFLCGVAVLAYRDRLPLRPLIWMAVILAAVALVSALINPPIMLAGTPRWYPFSSGVHTSAYAMAAVALLCWEYLRVLPRRAVFMRALVALTLGASLLMIYGYGVRSAQLFLAAYLLTDLVFSYLVYRRIGLNFLFFVVIGSASLIFVVAGVYAIALGVDGLTDVSSGRVSNYLERLSILVQSDVQEIIFGRGLGSDLIVVGVWWWEAKGSHSDILTFLWEGGIVGFTLIAAYVGMTWRLNFVVLTAPVVALLAASAISNSYLVRPNVAFLLFVLCAVRWVVRDDKHS